MFERWWTRSWITALPLVAMLSLAGCGDAPDGPFLTIAGGGFIFNVRAGDAYYGVSIRVHRPLEPGTTIEAEFENPAGGDAYRVVETVGPALHGYRLESPTVTGVVAGRAYRVAVSVREKATGRTLQHIEYSIRSDVDQSLLPDRPLTVGPGYAPNPDAAQPQQ